MISINIWIYALVSVFIVSLVSLIGIFTLFLNSKKLEKILIYFVAFSAGALFAGAFLHLLPEIIEEAGFSLKIPIFILLGLVIFFIIEKVIFWHHCHVAPKKHVHSFAIMNLVGDAFHNFLDGLIIAASYIVSIPLGIITTFAVILHEIPQEIGDFGILLHGGFSKRKALLMNFVTALAAVIGAVIALLLSGVVEGIETFLVPIAIGGFIYIAGSDLIPELNKEPKIWNAILQLIAFIAGILVMVGLLFLE